MHTSNSASISLVLLMGVFSTTHALADDDTKERIRDTASSIVQEIGESDISDSEQTAVLQDLRALLSQVRGGTPGDGSDLFCEPWSSSSSYLARLSDGTRLGDRVSTQKCQQIIAASRVDLVCQPWSEASGYVTDVRTGATLGDRVKFEQCFSLIAAATPDLLCTPWSETSSYVTARVTGSNLGDRVSSSRCIETISKAKRGLVCSPWSETSAYITRIATGEKIGDRVSFAQCYAAL